MSIPEADGEGHLGEEDEEDEGKSKRGWTHQSTNLDLLQRVWALKEVKRTYLGVNFEDRHPTRSVWFFRGHPQKIREWVVESFLIRADGRGLGRRARNQRKRLFERGGRAGVDGLFIETVGE